MTTTFPTVTITVAGTTPAEPVDPADVATLQASLHMVYAQAVKGDQRQQWVVFPPALAALGVPQDKIPAGPATLLLARLQEFKGNRSKWFHSRLPHAGQRLPEAMKSMEADGWTLGAVIVVPLEVDDYVSAWEGNTPHKAMRAIDRALKPLGVSVK